MLGGDSGGMEGRASEKGMDPSLITGMLSMLGGGGGGASGGGGGFNLQSLLQVLQDCQIFHYSIWIICAALQCIFVILSYTRLVKCLLKAVGQVVVHRVSLVY